MENFPCGSTAQWAVRALLTLKKPVILLERPPDTEPLDHRCSGPRMQDK
jgi:hypothetical protein